MSSRDRRACCDNSDPPISVPTNPGFGPELFLPLEIGDGDHPDLKHAVFGHFDGFVSGPISWVYGKNYGRRVPVSTKKVALPGALG